jgi:hypothetical protein
MNKILEITIITWEQISKAIMKVVIVEIVWNVQLAKMNLCGIIYEDFMKLMIIRVALTT